MQKPKVQPCRLPNTGEAIKLTPHCIVWFGICGVQRTRVTSRATSNIVLFRLFGEHRRGARAQSQQDRGRARPLPRVLNLTTNRSPEMAYSWDNRVAFVVRYLYDIDNNGYLDSHDFACLALRSCVLEGKGDCSAARLQKYQHIMLSLWEEISQLADFDKDGTISVDEFKQAVKANCVGRKYDDFPQAMKAFIESNFKIIDINTDGVIGIEEYRYDCVQRMVVEEIKVIDDAFNSLLNDDDRRKGGLTLGRYQELFAQFLGDQSEDCPAKHLFGPLEA